MRHPSNPSGWWAAYFATVSDGAVLRMRPDSEVAFEVNASRNYAGGFTPIRSMFKFKDVSGLSAMEIDGVDIPHEVFNAAWRVHVALKAGERGDRWTIISNAMGPSWTVDQPHLFEKWPRCLVIE